MNIISNLNKTLGITNAISKIITSKNVESVLSIYCGKGGDMSKYFLNGIKYMVGVDPDSEALSDFRKRYDSYSTNKKSKMFKLDLIETRLEDDEFITKIGQQKFDVIDIQLRIHFSLLHNTYTSIMEKIKYFCKSGTKMLISTNDGEELEKEFSNSKKLQFIIDKHNKNIKFYITKINNEKISIYYEPSTTD